MNIININKHFCTASLLSLPLVLFSCKTNSSPKTNVLLIIADDQGWGDLSINGNPYLTTPNIDSFAMQSVTMERFFVSPVSAPTRASLLTGKYHWATGAVGVSMGLETMKTEELTMAEIFKANGYKTACFGKWHNGKHYPYHPNRQGFDHFFGFIGGDVPVSYFNPPLSWNDTVVQTKGYCTDILTDSVIHFLKKNARNPFFCYVPFNAPHSPYEVSDDYYLPFIEKGLDPKTAAVYGMCKNLDDNTGRILRVVRELGLEENTIVIYLSDNGPNGVRYNGNMRGIKASPDVGGVRVPFFIRWKNHFPAGLKISHIAAHIDILPTLIELCRLNVPESVNVDGRSIASWLLGTESSLFYRNIFTGFKNNFSLRNQQYRLVLRKGIPELYDMIVDPEQDSNIFLSCPDSADKYLQLFLGWEKLNIPQEEKKRPIPVVKEAKTVVLPADESSFTGNVKFNGGHGYNGDWLTGWSTHQDTISWILDVKEEGTYQVAIQYSCDSVNTGSEVLINCNNQNLRFFVRDAFTPVNYPVFDRSPRGGVKDHTWGTVIAGNISLKKGLTPFKLFALSIKGNHVMDFESIELIKIQQ